MLAAVAAKRLNIASSILLVVAGICMALVPGLPNVELAPELVPLVTLLTDLQSRADRSAVSVLDPRSADHNRVDDTDHGRGPLHLGVPRHLHSTLAQPGFAKTRSTADLAGSIFTGVRGVVSLATALAIPYALANGQPFPHRDLIQYVTFGAIIVTLVGQGLMMPAMVRWLGLNQLGK